jgi:hypothetical protein
MCGIRGGESGFVVSCGLAGLDMAEGGGRS